MAQRILIIDDEPHIARFLSFIVKRGGYETRTAATGEEGLTMLHTTPFDAVVLDLELPGISGIDVLREIRANPAWQELMVIVLSGHFMEGGENCLLDLGATAQCPKPVAPSTLLAKLAPLRSELRTPTAP